MSETGEHIEDLGSLGQARPEADRAPASDAWLGQSDPLESFGNTVEQALRHLSMELAGLRAERDGLRLELEGLRTQLALTQSQLADRERFTATVRELGNVVRQLTLPSRWAGDDQLSAELRNVAAATEAPPDPSWPPVPPAWTPTPAAHDQAWATLSGPEGPARQAPVPPVPPPAWDPAVAAQIHATPVAPQPAPEPPPGTWAMPAPELQAWAAPPATPWPTPEAPAPQAWVTPAAPQPPSTPPSQAPAWEAPAASPGPVWIAPPAAPEVTWVAPGPVAPQEPTPQPAAWAAPAAPQPDAQPWTAPDPAPPAHAQPEPTRSTGELRLAHSPSEETFFEQPGVWIGEPPQAQRRRDTFKVWGSRVASVVAGIVVIVVLAVSVGPKLLPYQTYFVRSGSMEPTIETGAMIVLTKVDAAELVEGDIITFDRPDRPGTLVTHRIVGIENGASGKVFRTKGDANGSDDAWRVPATGTGWRHAFDVPKIGYAFGYLGTPQARLALLAVPAVLLGILSLIDIWKPSPKTAKTTKTSRRR